MKKTADKKTKLIALALAVFLFVMTAWIGVLYSRKAKLEQELSERQAELAALEEENAALEALVDEENITALMEEYARKSGYVYPDERVYIDGD